MTVPGFPQVYTDPTGGFSVAEISITGAVQNITNNWQTIAVTAARRYLTGKVREAVTDALLQGFTKVLPKGKLTAAVFGGSVDVMEQGKIFGAKVRELFCGALGDPEWIAFAPGIRTDGTPAHNGFTCGDPRIGDKDYDGPSIEKDVKRPDAVLGPYRVTQQVGPGRQPNGQKNWIVAEMKRSAASLVTQYVGASAKGRGQLDAIAGYTEKYTVTGEVAAFVTLLRGAQNDEQYKALLQKFAGETAKRGIVAIVITLTEFGRGKKR